MFVYGILCDMLAKKDLSSQLWLCAISCIITIAFLFLFLFLPDYKSALICFIPVIFFGAFYVGPSYALAQGLAKLRMRALASAIVMFFNNLLGLGLGPLMIGMLNDYLKPTYGDEAVRYSMTIISITTLWAAGHFVYAARHIKKDLQAQSQQ